MGRSRSVSPSVDAVQAARDASGLTRATDLVDASFAVTVSFDPWIERLPSQFPDIAAE
jgi:hypothetical protein